VAEVDAVLTRLDGSTHLGGDEHAAAVTLRKPASDDALAVSPRVAVGRVESGDAEGERGVQHGDGLVVAEAMAERFARAADAADGAAADDHRGDVEARATQRTLSHGDILES